MRYHAGDRTQEWFPSISATIGDWYPERNYFQIGMALASGPRFALVFAGYWIMRHGLQQRKLSNALNVATLVIGIVRTVTATLVVGCKTHHRRDPYPSAHQ